ncbi:MAG TPA: hypothetical protein VGA52_12315 [Anaerolineales bacterium]|jgi:hypothetical protein
MAEMSAAVRYAAAADPDQSEQLDLFAYLVLALRQINESVEESAAAWERRAYWVKADRFRHDWRWAARTDLDLSQALKTGDLVKAGQAAAALGPVLTGAARRTGKDHKRPWRGAHAALQAKDQQPAFGSSE